MGYLRHCTYSFGILFLIGTGSVFAFASNSPEANHFTNSYKAYQETSNKYHQDGVIGFTKKLNTAIKNHTDLRAISDSCGGCDVVLPEFDEYLKDNLPLVNSYDNKAAVMAKLQEKKYANIILGRFLHQNVSKRTTTSLINALNTYISEALVNIVQDVDYQTTLHHGLTAPGSYIDGDLTNFPYDIIDDMQKIWKLLLKDPPQYEGFINTMQNDATGLITGRFETGEWAQGDQYEIDLASDVESALGQGEDGGTGSDDSSDDCEDGFCIMLDIISNDSYSGGGRGTGFVDSNFEEIFGSALDWLIKKGDKRNIACKAPPPVNHFQSNNDQNLSFKNIFRGLGIFLFQKTPKYAQPESGSEKEKTVEQKEKDVDGVIADSFKNYNIDPEHLMLYTQKQMVEQATPIARRAGETSANQEWAEHTLKQRQNIETGALVAIKVKEASNADKGTKNMFRSFASSMQSLYETNENMLKDGKELNDKEPCQN